MSATEVVPDQIVSPPRLSLWRRAPGRVFHGLLVAPTLVLLWTWSFPAPFWLVVIPVVWVFMVLGLVWVVRATTWLVAKRRGVVTAPLRNWALIPLVGVLTLVLMVGEVPLRLRWQIGRADFEAAVRDRADDGGAGRLGTYEIRDVELVDGGVLFYERYGNFLDYAGFAYLPNGPDETLRARLEVARFRHLDGDWYTFTASW